jgi:23S rRNA pseudouridine2605 synthase
VGEKMRIHVWLAKHTNISRRKAEVLVQDGRVQIGGCIAQIGQKVEAVADVRVDGKIIRNITVDRQVLALHKPVGYVCSQSPQDQLPSVFDLLPKLSGGKWVLVGRLDVNTSGLLLVTTDGNLANKLAHPSHGFEREYLVRISQTLTQSMLDNLRGGVMLDDGEARVQKIQPHGKPTQGANAWYMVILKEGRNRIVRRLMASQGVNISRLIRVRFGPIKLEKALNVGKYQTIDCAWIDQYLANR